MTRDAESRFPWLLLRVALGGQFIAAAMFSALNWSATVDFNAALVGSSLAPFATAAAVGLLVVGGLSLTFDVRARVGALLLLAFLVPASVRHIVVAMDVAGMAGLDADAITAELAELARRGQLASVAKNIALIGVVAFVAIRGVGPSPSTHERSGS